MNSSSLCAILLLSLLSVIVETRKLPEYAPKLSFLGTNFSEGDGKSRSNGTRWAVLVAGSSGFGNYRHQADVCHAYQILKSGGLKDENIIVFMYDDIAFNDANPRPGILINKPYGTDVYYGVPKDYNGENVTTNNFLAVILGNKTALSGGSGKVLNSGPNDHIFIYYTDHGSPGMLGMPSGGALYANDLIDVLKKKHSAKAYKSMVIYLEACESGSIFDGLLPNNLNIYAMTASNPVESSWALYCPDHYPYTSPEFITCLGDLFSVSWLEDSDKHDMQKETLEKQYEVVRRRTLADYYDFRSHVMRYGNVMGMKKDSISTYIGTNPANENFTFTKSSSLPPAIKAVSQQDADLSYLWHKFNKAPEGSYEKVEAQKQLLGEIAQRKRVDLNIKCIATSIYGNEKGSQMLESVRPAGQPLVDDWDCLKMLVKNYEEHCGSLSTYGRKYTRAMANMCNAGISEKEIITESIQACFMQTPSS